VNRLQNDLQFVKWDSKKFADVGVRVSRKPVGTGWIQIGAEVLTWTEQEGRC